MKPNQTEKIIPQYSLLQMSKWASVYRGDLPKYSAATFTPGYMLQNSPYKTTFYGIILCITGTVELKANDECYQLKQGSLIVLGPEVVRKWINLSSDFCAKTMAFTEHFFTEDNIDATLLRRFNFFHSNAIKVVQLGENEISSVCEILEEVKHLLETDSKRKNQIIRSYTYILLNLTADSFDRHCSDETGLQKNPSNLTDRFKQLLNTNYMHVRSVSDYANLLFVTSKHLSETLKLTTGKTAGQLIDEMVLMEAKIRLKHTSLNVSQIASFMNFSDVSAFGKFFKKHTGIRPAEYSRD